MMQKNNLSKTDISAHPEREAVEGFSVLSPALNLVLYNL